MVKDTRKTLHTDAFKLLNIPEPVSVEESPSGIPLSLGSKQRREVAAIEDWWRIDDEWWRADPLSRVYFTVRLASGRRLVLYKDNINDRWYRQSY